MRELDRGLFLPAEVGQTGLAAVVVEIDAPSAPSCGGDWD